MQSPLVEMFDLCPDDKSISDLLLKAIPPAPQEFCEFNHFTTLVSADEFQLIVAYNDGRDRKKGGSLSIKSFVGKVGVK